MMPTPTHTRTLRQQLCDVGTHISQTGFKIDTYNTLASVIVLPEGGVAGRNAANEPTFIETEFPGYVVVFI